MPDFNPITYLREVRTELKKVTWPSRQVTLNMTSMVVLISIATALYLGVLDYMFVQISKVIY